MQDQEHETDVSKQSTDDDSETVNIKPSEPNDGASNQDEENAPGRTSGKAEGSRKIIEEDLAQNKK